MKENILKYFKGLGFDEKKHQYNINGKVIDKSVTGLVDEFAEEFDSDKMSMLVAKRDGTSQEEVLSSWQAIKDKACDIGNKTHEFGEDYIFNRELIPTTPYEEGIVKFWNDLPGNYIPVVPELRMYHKEDLYAGTADVILFDRISTNFVICDYKGFPLDTCVLTDKGFKTIGSLTYDDKVYDKDGDLCNITGISSIHKKPCLKITFDNYETIVCDEDHKWLVIMPESINNDKYIRVSDNELLESEEVLTTREIKDRLDFTSTRRPYIQNSSDLKINKNCPIDPYVFGYLVAKTHQGSIDISKEVQCELDNRGYNKDITINNLEDVFLDYILCSTNDRIEILQGIMDNSGVWRRTMNEFTIRVKSKSHIDLYKILLSSLGIKVFITKYLKDWDISFAVTKFSVFLCNSINVNVKNIHHTRRKIVSIEEVPTVETKCIEVDSPSRTYLVTKSLIVTHNTNKDLFKNYKGKKLFKPFDFLLDTPFNKYQIQLSYYQLLFEQMGYNVMKRNLIWLNTLGTYKLYTTKDYTDILRGLK